MPALDGPVDLIVVGAGSAGIPCAITAAQHGARVIVLEKTDEIGGSLWVAGGKLSGGGTRRQAERGIEDSPDLHFEDVMRITHGAADAAIVRRAVEEAPQTIDWLEDLGFPFDPDTPALAYLHEPYSRPRTYWGPGPALATYMARTVLETMRPLWDEQVAAGNIDLRLEHRMRELVEQDGRVVGVVADGPNGEQELRAAAVVLSTGGYGSNPALFAELAPGAPRLVSHARPGSTGDGLLAARRVGAAIRNADLFLPGPGAVEEEPGTGRASEGWARLHAAYRVPREIHVNRRGERFRPEDDPSAESLEQAMLAQPEAIFWLVFDEAALVGGESVHTVWDQDELRRRAQEGKCIWTADSLEELAVRAGIDPDGLTRTGAEWNEAVATGHDPLGCAAPTFGLSTAPFYALLTHSDTLVTPGGIHVDEQLRVLDSSADPIPGLYAAGEVLGSGATMGRGSAGGMMVTPAISFGRLLGRTLAPASGEDPVAITASSAPALTTVDDRTAV